MEKTKMKQNKKHVSINEQIIIAPVCLFLTIILLITICSVPGLADSTNNIDFSAQPLPIVSDSSFNTVQSSGLGLSTLAIANNPYGYGASLGEEIYCYGVYYSQYTAYLIFSSPVQNAVAYVSERSTVTSVTCSSYDPNTQLYSGTWTNGNSKIYSGTAYNMNIPLYNKDYDARIDIRNYIDNRTPSGDVIPLTTSYYTLDSGAYYKASENDKAAFALVGDIENGFTVIVGTIDPNCFIYKATDSSVSPVSLFRSNNLNLANFYSNQNAGMIHPSGIDLSAFETASDAEGAIYNYLVEEGGTPTDTTSNSLTYSLPPGNVMFIDISSAIGSITLETSSSIAGGVSQNEFNSYNNQAIGYLASFPDSFTLPLNGTTDIQWSASGNPTILGTYHKFQYTSAINGGGNQYLVIVNPTYDNLAISEGNLQADNPSATNSYIDIRCSAQNFYIFSLDAQISFSDGSWQLDSESSNTQFTGTYDPTTQTWNTTDSITGLPAQPTVGGANDIPTTDPAQAASNFTTWLKNFLSSFISIFDAGKTAITTLVGYAQPFFNTIGSLYSWLPAPVYAVLVSGLTLVVIVGVIKVFL